MTPRNTDATDETPTPKPGFFAWSRTEKSSYSGGNSRVPNPGGIIRSAVAGLLALVVAITLLSGLTNVDSTEAAVVFHRDGSLSIMGPGKFQFVPPIVNTVTKYDVRENVYTQTAVGISLDLQETTTEVTVLYAPDRAAIQTIHQTLGTGYEAKVVVPAVQSCVKNAVSHYNVEQLTGGVRAQVNDAIATCITNDLKAANLLVTKVSVTDFDFSDLFNHAIEAKAIAQQRAQEEKNKLEQTIYEANQTVIRAQAQADAARLIAQATSGQQGESYMFLQCLDAWRAGGSQVPSIANGAITPCLFQPGPGSSLIVTAPAQGP